MSGKNSVETLTDWMSAFGKVVIGLPIFLPFLGAGVLGYFFGQSQGWHPMFSLMLAGASFMLAIVLLAWIHWILEKFVSVWVAAIFNSLWASSCYGILALIITNGDKIWAAGALILAFVLIFITEKNKIDNEMHRKTGSTQLI